MLNAHSQTVQRRLKNPSGRLDSLPLTARRRTLRFKASIAMHKRCEPTRTPKPVSEAFPRSGSADGSVFAGHFPVLVPRGILPTKRIKKQNKMGRASFFDQQAEFRAEISSVLKEHPFD